MEIDIIRINEIGLRLAKTTQTLKRRHFINNIELGKEPRIKVLVGFRGLGKTTALLQLLQEDKKIYFSFDHPYVLSHSFYELGKACIKAGYKTLLVDEVHHYKSWKLDSKALYDEFPEANLVLSGSAPLAFEPERRYEIITVDPMSLKEFLDIQEVKCEDPQEAWKSSEKTVHFLAANSDLYEWYGQYIQGGGFPIYLTYKEKTLTAIFNGIQKSIREDAPFFSRVSGEDIVVMEKLLLSLATSSLGEFSINHLAQQLGMKKYKGYELISLLQKMKILRLVRPWGRGPKLVRGDPKLMFYHPNLRWALCKAMDAKPDIGATREELAVFSLARKGWQVNTLKGMKKNPDYIIQKGDEKLIIEVGGASKTRRQLEGFAAEKTIILDERQLIVLAM